ncbi:MAG: ABC transporter permease subunit [Collinsella intestinalis]
MTVFLQYLANGLTMGSVYAIIALGYTMVYGIAKMLNFAHGDVIMIGAYISFVVTSYMGLPAIVSVLAAAACARRSNSHRRSGLQALRQAARLPSSSPPSASRISCRTPPSSSGAPRPRISRPS